MSSRCGRELSSWLDWTLEEAPISNMAGQEDPVQREIHQDWANREYIEVITSSIKKIADFLNSFGEHSRPTFSGKITTIETLRRWVKLSQVS